MACENFIKMMAEMSADAVARSGAQAGQEVQINRKCDNPKGCPFYFYAIARNGVFSEGGVDFGADITGDCPITGGSPSSNVRK